MQFSWLLNAMNYDYESLPTDEETESQNVWVMRQAIVSGWSNLGKEALGSSFEPLCNIVSPLSAITLPDISFGRCSHLGRGRVVI